MSKSSPLRLFGRRAHRPVMVVAASVAHNYARKAKVAFFAMAGIVGLLSASVLTASHHPIISLFLGMLLGTAAGAVSWLIVRCWPGLRFGWWWLPEILIGIGVFQGFTALAGAIPNTIVLSAVLLLLVGLPAAIPVSRRFVWAWATCLAVRHRLRLLFTDVIKSNQHGSLPLILLARPTPVGERVWIFLRPGLSKDDIANRLGIIASACWATTVMVEQPGANSAYLRLDIKRREVLTHTISNPLMDLVDKDAPIPARPTPVFPSQLNLSDIPELIKVAPFKRNGSTPGRDNSSSTSDSGKTAPRNDPDDLERWI